MAEVALRNVVKRFDEVEAVREISLDIPNHGSQVATVGSAVGRIAGPVAPNIGQAIGGVWVRPKIRRDAHVIMLVPARRQIGFFHHREWSNAERGFALALEFGQRGRPLRVALPNAPPGRLQRFRVEQKNPRST